MTSKSRLHEPKHLRSVVEWQFPRAHRYWDDCGKLITAIEAAFPGLTCQALQPNGFHFTGLSKGITRLGHRTWVVYETGTAKEANQWLDGFQYWSLSNQDLLGSPDVAGSVIRTKLELGGRRLRLEVNAGTMGIDLRQYHGVIVDVDIASTSTDQDVSEFVAWNGRFIRETIEPLFRRK